LNMQHVLAVPVLLLASFAAFAATLKYDNHYLLSAHLAAGLLYVVDLRTNKVLKAIPNVPGVEGVEFVPELKKVTRQMRAITLSA